VGRSRMRATVRQMERPVEIRVRDNGPYKVTGSVRLVDPEGNEIPFDRERPLVLCRCGRSRTKPFCDKAHREMGFSSCVRAAGDASG
jgi:CDGSH iron-sulfur domain-containing protein 3